MIFHRIKRDKDFSSIEVLFASGKFAKHINNPLPEYLSFVDIPIKLIPFRRSKLTP